jgi:UDPglucose--hexose-1-phosphate uridylyltransferase
MPSTRAVTHLADGRELIYFSAAGTHAADLAAVPDRRELPERPPASEIRHDPLVEEWVAIAAHRQTRTLLPPSDACPLCPSTPDRATEVPAPDYEVAVFENRFPAFPALPVLPASPADGGGLHADEPRPANGRCEVVCFSADHDASFADLSPGRVRLIVDAWADRTAELAARPGVEQVFCFENRGEEIGVSIRHPHGQIYAFPFVTPRTRQMLRAARAHHERTGGNVFADVLAAEWRAGTRIVAGNRWWTAFVPSFARWPFEVHVYPHRRVPDIPALSEAERDGFGPVYLDVLRRLDAVYGLTMPYVAAWHQAPVTGRDGRDLAYLHLQLFSNRRAPDKLKHPAGTEAAMGVFLNDVDPDDAARLLQGTRGHEERGQG